MSTCPLPFFCILFKSDSPTSAPLLCWEEVDGTFALLAALCQLSLPLGMCCRFHGNRIVNLFFPGNASKLPSFCFVVVSRQVSVCMCMLRLEDFCCYLMHKHTFGNQIRGSINKSVKQSLFFQRISLLLPGTSWSCSLDGMWVLKYSLVSLCLSWSRKGCPAAGREGESLPQLIWLQRHSQHARNPAGDTVCASHCLAQCWGPGWSRRLGTLQPGLPSQDLPLGAGKARHPLRNPAQKRQYNNAPWQ